MPEKPGYVLVQPVATEIIFTATSVYSVIQVNAACMEDIESFVASERLKGISVSKPGSLDPATQKITPFPEVKYLDSKAFPVVVYLAVDSECKVKSKFSLS